MFKINPKKKLMIKYKRLMKEAFELSKINRKLSDSKYAEAELVMNKIEVL